MSNLKTLLEHLFDEEVKEQIVLYHGTSVGSAESLLKHGWTPNSGFTGGNGGQTRYLYLTNEPENARWFANEKGEDTVLKVLVPISSLIVDPEDGIEDTVLEELNHKVGYVSLFKPLGAEAFSIYEKMS